MRIHEKHNFVNFYYLSCVSFYCQYFIILETVVIINVKKEKLTRAQTTI